MLTHPKSNFSENYIVAPRWCRPLNFFTCARKWPRLANPHQPGTGSPNNFVYNENLKKNFFFSFVWSVRNTGEGRLTAGAGLCSGFSLFGEEPLPQRWSLCRRVQRGGTSQHRRQERRQVAPDRRPQVLRQPLHLSLWLLRWTLSTRQVTCLSTYLYSTSSTTCNSGGRAGGREAMSSP